MTLVVIVEDGSGLANANVFTSLAEANSYHEARPYASSWVAASSTECEKALILASKMLDIGVLWQGYKAYANQALAWPRTGVVDRDGYALSASTIPQFLKDATAELARHLLERDRTAEPTTQGYSRIQIDTLAFDIDVLSQPGFFPPLVKAYIQSYGKVIGQSGMAKLQRV